MIKFTKKTKNFLLSEFLAGIIILLQVINFKMWVQTSQKYYFYLVGSWTFVILLIVWYGINKKLNENDSN